MSSFRQWVFLLNESLRTLGRHKAVTALSIAIMSLTLLVLAVFLLATDNVMSLLDKTREEMQVYVYLYDGQVQQDIDRMHHDLLALEQVEAIEFISKDAAMVEFQTDLGEEQYILETLESNPLPASFRVSLKSAYQNREDTEAFAARVEKMQGVEEVNYGREFVERFSRFARIFIYVDIVLGIIVILSAIFIISNTVRLTIVSRERTIEILKLVGATDRFISTPFIMEGAFQGGLAALVSLALLTFIFAVTQRVVPDLQFLTPDKMAVYTLTCVLLGSLGSYAALQRFLKL